jgi:hypothetical protein
MDILSTISMHNFLNTAIWGKSELDMHRNVA